MIPSFQIKTRNNLKFTCLQLLALFYYIYSLAVQFILYSNCLILKIFLIFIIILFLVINLRFFILNYLPIFQCFYFKSHKNINGNLLYFIFQKPHFCYLHILLFNLFKPNKFEIISNLCTDLVLKIFH